MTLRPPEGYSEEQVASTVAFAGQVSGSNMDGADVVIVAWQPSEDELALLLAGSPVFIGFLGGVPPHFVTACFPGV